MKSLASTLDTEARLPKLPLPAARFDAGENLAPALSPIWKAMQKGAFRIAQSLAASALAGKALTSEERAALLAAQAAAELRQGRTAISEHYAGRSLQTCTKQTLARLILFEARVNVHDYTGAYGILTELTGRGATLSWDEPVPAQTLHIARAALAWRLRKWEAVAAHIEQAYPKGIASMPAWLLEDFFRLSLYRDRREDAAAVAALLIQTHPEESTDLLLQTMVQQGWTEQALPLYRSAYSGDPESALLRRRLVALCLREGAVDEARALTRTSPLAITPRGTGRSAR